MLNIGCHLSASKGFLHMAQETINIGGNTFQFFTRNPRGSQAKELDLKDISNFETYSSKHNIQQILAHAPYTLNPAAENPSTREFAEIVFKDDLKRMDFIPNNMYNFHPGSHVGQGIDTGINHIVSILNKVLYPTQKTMVLLETMSGKGSEIGSDFTELKTIIDRTELSDKLGVCWDTCHLFSAGYDIVNQLDNVLENFDKTIGLKRLRAIHLNDSLMPFQEKKDRHEKIGKGQIGLDALVRIINHPTLKNKPFYLETPHDDLSGYAFEIKMLKELYNP